ncbi:NAD-dependent epimerase/dehydratase family protein [Arthrobacter sp. BB-1]|uniref:NAD-dependent epimerase/dehydratase family protein n=1 Tax=unclassified Arthrobacter TaxID=235627 RepID=UPI0010EA3AAC|nr:MULTISPECIES: NAD-dependent epimerase/dehydratase family protein [unclassified Arthrobacter]TNB76238.1 NAD-dependent epimerase/dehydratase family protein [Arthrobacter sp. BB-1]VII98440.1 NAD-dependent epimerase/dehydratase [Arthrobacter sp. DR-2P]
MHIAITGASGNAGTALLRRLQARLSEKPGSLTLTGISRRRPDTSRAPYSGVEWHTLDVGLESDRPLLDAALAGVDAVVHLAWQIQPNRDLEQLYRTNVTGTRNVLSAAGRAGVKQVVCASSVGAYSKAPKDRRTDESWPARGMPGSHYSRHKAEQEEALDAFMAAHPGVPVARLRPALIFQRDAGSEIGRYFLGPLIPRLLPGRLRIPLLPAPEDLIFQAVHADDVADAYWRVIDRRASGAFNVAAEPVLTPQELARILGARRILPIPMGLLHKIVGAAWRLRLQPTDSGWIEMAAGAPIMDTSRAGRILGWEPKFSSTEAVAEVLAGMGTGEGITPSPVLKPR